MFENMLMEDRMEDRYSTQLLYLSALYPFRPPKAHFDPYGPRPGPMDTATSHFHVRACARACVCSRVQRLNTNDLFFAFVLFVFLFLFVC